MSGCGVIVLGVNPPPRVLLAGGSGFIGAAVARVLAREAISFTVADRRHGTDLSDWEQARLLPAMAAIIHVAGPGSAARSWDEPHRFYREHLLITLNLLELARLHRARLIFGSSYVYGIPQHLPIDEEHPANPSNPYMSSKLMAEQLCAAYTRDFGLPVTALRIFNPYGPGQPAAFLIPELIDGIRKGAVNLRDPAPRRDFVHVADIAEAVLAALRYSHSGFEVFNLGSGASIAVHELVSLGVRLSGREVSVRYRSESRQGEIADVVADVSKAAAVLCWSPRIPLDEGIRCLLNRDEIP
jgi:nucleoside-diphosphate-sugar epimerase